MTNHPDRELEIFSEARRLPASAHAAYLDQACGGDAALRQRVVELLEAGAAAGDFMESPAAAVPNPVVSAIENPGSKIGRYKLLQKIGEGGCGVVYMAEQTEPVRRLVALKIIKLGMDTKSVIARFEAERQALALMDHPKIATVLDAGATEQGRPYFVMELVRGVKITEFCDNHNLTTRERLLLFIQVCQAVQHAHQKGIIHRDLKPSNILVTLNDGVPLPKVIDFGIAKATQQRLTDKTLFTAFEQFIGTPAYMSPEQAEMNALGVDTRSDIYSLGVLLYELLTGETPFASEKLMQAGVNEIRRVIREEEPVKPSTKLSAMLAGDLTITANRRQTEPPKLLQSVRGDLDWVVMKTLEKDRHRRYQTANGLAMDIQRHLNNEPVLACPPSELYRIQKLVRRNKLAFLAAGAVIITLAAGLVVSTGMFFQEQQARRQAEAERKNAETEAAKSRQIAQFFKEILNGSSPYSPLPLDRDRTALRDIVDRTAARIGTELTNQPEVAAEIRETLASTYAGMGEWEKAVNMDREVLRLRKTVYGETNKFVAVALVELAFALSPQGKLVEAESVGREGLAMTRNAEGHDSEDTIFALDTLSRVLEDLDKKPEAERLEREALAVTERLHGTNNPAAGWELARLADILESEAKFAEAEPFARQSLALQRKFNGENAYTVDAIHVLTIALNGEGKLAEAEGLLREAWENYDMKFAARNMSGFASLADLTDVLTREGKLADAAKVLREGIELERTTTNYPNLIITSAKLAAVLQSEGNLAEARLMAEKAIDVFTNHPVEFAPWSADAILLSIKDIPLASGGTSPLEAVAAQFLEHQRNAGDPHDPWLVVLLSDDASLLAQDGKAGAARPLAEEAIKLCLAHPPTGNDGRIAERALYALSAALPDPGEIGELETNVLQFIQVERSVAPGPNPYFAELLADAANIFFKQGRLAQAQSLIREAKVIGDRHPPGFQPWMESKINELSDVISPAETTTNSAMTGLKSP